MAIAALIFIGWPVCGVVAYLVCRTDFRSQFGRWTKRDRWFFLKVSATGPFGLIASALLLLVEHASNPFPKARGRFRRFVEPEDEIASW